MNLTVITKGILSLMRNRRRRDNSKHALHTSYATLSSGILRCHLYFLFVFFFCFAFSQASVYTTKMSLSDE